MVQSIAQLQKNPMFAPESAINFFIVPTANDGLRTPLDNCKPKAQPGSHTLGLLMDSFLFLLCGAACMLQQNIIACIDGVIKS